jgi:hypothetical protein
MNEQYPDKILPVKKNVPFKQSQKYPGFLHWGKHPGIDFTGRTAIRFRDQKRIAIDPDLFFDRDHDRDYQSKTRIRLLNIALKKF